LVSESIHEICKHVGCKSWFWSGNFECWWIHKSCCLFQIEGSSVCIVQGCW